MGFFKKVKEWFNDCPSEAELNLFWKVFIPKGPTLSAAEQIIRDGLPFHIEWKSAGVRDDN